MPKIEVGKDRQICSVAIPGEVLHQIFVTRVQHVIQICKNNESKDLKSMKKGSFGSKIKGKFIQNA